MWWIIAWFVSGFIAYGWLMANYRELGVSMDDIPLYLLALITSILFIVAGPFLFPCIFIAFKCMDEKIVMKWRPW